METTLKSVVKVAQSSHFITQLSGWSRNVLRAMGVSSCVSISILFLVAYGMGMSVARNLPVLCQKLPGSSAKTGYVFS